METGRTAHGGSLAMMMLALDFGDGDGEGDGEDAAGPPVLGPAVTEGKSAGAPARTAQNGNRIISQFVNQSMHGPHGEQSECRVRQHGWIIDASARVANCNVGLWNREFPMQTSGWFRDKSSFTGRPDGQGMG